jgi:hypothetical protein
MISNFTIITVPQWAIFAAISVIIYGWVERKKVFGVVGSALIFVLGIFAAWVIFSGMLVPEGLFDTREAFDGEELFQPGEMPIEGRMLPFYWGMAINGVLGLSAAIAESLNKKYAKILKVMICLIALAIFFGILGVARM